jgi:Cytochrome P460
MKGFVLLLLAVATAAGVFVSTTPVSRQGAVYGGGQAAPIFGIKIPPGYREWKFVSVAHEEGNLHSIGALLANDVAFNAFRDGKLPFPDGSILAALHYKHVPSEENNKVFGDPQSFVAGPPTNIQFMVKDSAKFASTGGWGYAHFDKDGNPGTEAALKTCAPCHAKATRDHVFTQYAP